MRCREISTEKNVEILVKLKYVSYLCHVSKKI